MVTSFSLLTFISFLQIDHFCWLLQNTKISPKGIEDYKEFIWKPKVDSIKRPVRSLALQGVITTVHGNSGLIKRCNKCKSIFYDDECPNKCPKEEGWGWDLRVSC